MSNPGSISTKAEPDAPPSSEEILKGWSAMVATICQNLESAKEPTLKSYHTTVMEMILILGLALEIKDQSTAPSMSQQQSADTLNQAITSDPDPRIESDLTNTREKALALASALASASASALDQALALAQALAQARAQIRFRGWI